MTTAKEKVTRETTYESLQAIAAKLDGLGKLEMAMHRHSDANRVFPKIMAFIARERDDRLNDLRAIEQTGLDQTWLK